MSAAGVPVGVPITGVLASRFRAGAPTEAAAAGQAPRKRPCRDDQVVWKISRLGRNTRQLPDLVDHRESSGVHFPSVTEGIATIGPTGNAMLPVMSASAQLERDQLADEPGLA